MDRFIALLSLPIKSYLCHLKSNMDRFIVGTNRWSTLLQQCLKSNMDRFIVVASHRSPPTGGGLKSNMDRFIANAFSNGAKFG